ncbi:unnamed protein product [Caenorhabditis brenneri]
MSTDDAPNRPEDIFPFLHLPYLPRKELFEYMSPSALVAVYQTCSTAHHLFPPLAGTVSIHYDLRKPLLHVESFHSNQKSVLPFIAFKSLRKIFTILELEDVYVEIDENEDYTPLMEFLKSYGRCRTMKICSKNEDYCLNMEDLQDLLGGFQFVKKVEFGVQIENWPSGSPRFLKSAVVDISDGTALDRRDIRRITRGSKEVRINSSRLSDKSFNFILLDWLHGRNKTLRYLEITARDATERQGRRILNGIRFRMGNGGTFQPKYLKEMVRFHTGWDVERESDGRRATIVSTRKKFRFIVWD